MAEAGNPLSQTVGLHLWTVRPCLFMGEGWNTATLGRREGNYKPEQRGWAGVTDSLNQAGLCSLKITLKRTENLTLRAETMVAAKGVVYSHGAWSQTDLAWIPTWFLEKFLNLFSSQFLTLSVGHNNSTNYKLMRELYKRVWIQYSVPCGVGLQPRSSPLFPKCNQSIHYSVTV